MNSNKIFILSVMLYAGSSILDAQVNLARVPLDKITLSPTASENKITLQLPPANSNAYRLYQFTPTRGPAQGKLVTLFIQGVNHIGSNPRDTTKPAGYNLFLVAPNVDLSKPVPATMGGTDQGAGCFYSIASIMCPNETACKGDIMQGNWQMPGVTYPVTITKEGTLFLDANTIEALGCIAADPAILLCKQ